MVLMYTLNSRLVLILSIYQQANKTTTCSVSTLKCPHGAIRLQRWRNHATQAVCSPRPAITQSAEYVAVEFPALTVYVALTQQNTMSAIGSARLNINP